MRTNQRLLIEITGHEIEVVVSTAGEFWAEWEGESYRSTTLVGLRKKLLPVVRGELKRCAIPALDRDYSGEFKPITLIGIHASNNNALYVDEKGQTHQVRGYGRSSIYRPMTNAQLERHRLLMRAVKKAERELKAFLKRFVIVPNEEVRKALGMPATPKDEPDDFDDDDEDLE